MLQAGYMILLHGLLSLLFYNQLSGVDPWQLEQVVYADGPATL